MTRRITPRGVPASTHQYSLPPSMRDSGNKSQLTEEEQGFPKAVRDVLVSLTQQEKLVRRTFCTMMDLAIKRATGAAPPSPSYPRVFPAWDGTQSSSGRNYKESKWPELIRLCESEGANVFEYIADVLASWPHTYTPEPKHMLDKLRIRKTIAMRSVLIENLKRELMLQQSSTRNRFYAAKRMNEDMGITDLTYAHNSVINASTPPMTPLFRYAYAVSVGNTAAAGRLIQQAALQYLIYRNAYDQVWGNLIPEAFKRATTDELSNYSGDSVYVPASFPIVDPSAAGN